MGAHEREALHPPYQSPHPTLQYARTRHSRVELSAGDGARLIVGDALGAPRTETERSSSRKGTMVTREVSVRGDEKSFLRCGGG